MGAKAVRVGIKAISVHHWAFRLKIVRPGCQVRMYQWQLRLITQGERTESHLVQAAPVTERVVGPVP